MSFDKQNMILIYVWVFFMSICTRLCSYLRALHSSIVTWRIRRSYVKISHFERKFPLNGSHERFIDIYVHFSSTWRQRENPHRNQWRLGMALFTYNRKWDFEWSFLRLNASWSWNQCLVWLGIYCFTSSFMYFWSFLFDSCSN